jgi:hypothetical protein
VLFETGSGAKITDVEVYDGEKKIADFSGLSLSGKHTTSVDSKNSWTISPAKDLVFGVSICVRVDFGPAQTGSVPAIRFASAGIDVLTS